MSKLFHGNIHKRVFVAVLIVAVALAFSPIMANTAHAATSKFTLYKGQKIKVTFFASKAVKFTSSKAKIVKTKKGKNNTFTMQALKAGKSNLTASAKGYKTKKYAVTVKGSYPSGSINNPVPVVNGSWQAIKSMDGKKQINVKATVYKAETAKKMINDFDGKPDDGTSYFDQYYYNKAAVSAGRTLYLIQYDYQVVKGFPAGKGAYLSRGLGYTFYNNKWTQLTTAQYATYTISATNVSSSVSEATNGAKGTYYSAIFMDNAIKEIRSRDVSGIYDYQQLGSFGTNRDLILSGCVTIKLP